MTPDSARGARAGARRCSRCSSCRCRWRSCSPSRSSPRSRSTPGRVRRAAGGRRARCRGSWRAACPRELRLEPATSAVRIRRAPAACRPTSSSSRRRPTARCDATLVARRRGRHALPPPVASADRAARARRAGRTGSGEAARAASSIPDLPARAAARAAPCARAGSATKAAGAGRSASAPSSSRSATTRPDDDIRQVNWRAAARLGRPMSNQFRVERDRDVVCVVDCGRLMAAPLGVRHAARRRDRRGRRGRRRRGRARRPLRRDRVRRRAAALAAAPAAPARATSSCGAVRPRADRRSTATTSARSRQVGERQARVRPRAHRPARRGGGAAALDALPVLARRHAVAVAERRPIPTSTRLVRTEPHVAGRRLPGCRRARRARRARACRGAAAACGRRRGRGAAGDASPRRASGRICGRSGRRGSRSSHARERAPSRRHPGRRRCRRPRRAPSPDRLARIPSTSPAITSQGAVPSTRSSAVRAPRAAARRGACAGRATTIDQPSRRPAAPRDDDAGELEHAVRRHELEEADAVAGLPIEPADHPEQDAVVEERAPRSRVRAGCRPRTRGT